MALIVKLALPTADDVVLAMTLETVSVANHVRSIGSAPPKPLSVTVTAHLPALTSRFATERLTALAQAKDGRDHILAEMDKALNAPRPELGEHAPRIETMKIPVDKIREVIGTGGKVIREIVEKTGAKINIEDDGTVKVASAKLESIKAAIAWIKSIASEPEFRKNTVSSGSGNVSASIRASVTTGSA